MSEYLVHYGVKGMKWGKRKQDFKDLDENVQDKIVNVIDSLDYLTSKEAQDLGKSRSIYNNTKDKDKPKERLRGYKGGVVNSFVPGRDDEYRSIGRENFGSNKGWKARIKDRLRNGESVWELKKQDPQLSEMGKAAVDYVHKNYYEKYK